MKKFFKKIYPTRNKETKAPVISRRIIISVLLAVFLWLGVGFGIQKTEAISLDDYCIDTGTGSTMTSCIRFYNNPANHINHSVNDTTSSSYMGYPPNKIVEIKSRLTTPGPNVANNPNNNENKIFNAKKAVAATEGITPDEIKARSDAIDECNRQFLTNSSGGTPLQIKSANNVLDTCISSASTLIWKGEPSWASQIAAWATGKVTGTLAKTVMMINGILLQFIAIPIMSVLFRLSAAFVDMATRFTLSTQIFQATASGVVIIWTLIRDICNITFIFILLWTSIQTILGTASGKTKKMIADVIIAALLINFSLFITRILIDVGNILGIALYNQIMAGGGSMDTVIMSNLGLTGITGMFEDAAKGGVFSVGFGIVSYLQLITFFIGFMTFMYMVLLLVTRIVVLIFLAAMSPIGFMGDVLPKLAEYSKSWRETLYGQVMVAPIFLLFLYLIMKVGKNFNVVPAVNSAVSTAANAAVAAAPAADDPTAYLGFFKYIMVIMLLIIAVKTTKKMTGAIGGAIEGVVKAAVGIAIGAVTGGVAMLGRRTIGAGAAGLMNGKAGEYLKNKDNFASRLALRGLSGTSKASFDARKTSGFKAATGFIGDQTGLKIDYDRGVKTKEGGFKGTIETRAKKQAAYAKEMTEDMGASPSEITAKREELEGQTSAARTENQANIARTQQALSAIASNPGLTPEVKAEQEKKKLTLEKELADLSKKEFKDITDDDVESALKDTVKQRKDARVKMMAEHEKGGLANWALGGAQGRKSAAKAVRKLSKEKSADDIIKEYNKQKAKEDKEKGIDSEEEKPKSMTPTPSTTQTPAV